MTRRVSLALAMVTLPLVLGACQPFTGGVITEASAGTSSAGSEESGSCEGQAGCECASDGSCDPGLMCVEDMCVPEGGDGDGDMTTGDGDGDMTTTTTTTGDGDGDPSCTMAGCMCDGSPGSCDPGLSCMDGTCVAPVCGDGVVDPGEECDDADPEDGDGCDNDCTYTTVLVRAGTAHTCALIEGGRVRCWGNGNNGRLGYGNTDAIGDDEAPATAGDVQLPFPAVDLGAGTAHTCARFEDQRVRCWGSGTDGRLGYGNADHVGNAAPLDNLDFVAVGGTPVALAVGGAHNCVILDGGAGRCWGLNGDGQLGLGDTNSIGDDELPDSIAALAVGGGVFTQVAAGVGHSCVVNDADELYCWGKNNHGQLGLGNSQDFGENEKIDAALPIEVYPDALPNNETIAQVALGKDHSCVLFTTGEVLCWGRASSGQLGQANTDEWGNGNNELPNLLAPIELGDSAIQISAGGEFSCALLASGDVRCWGKNDVGQLGLADNVNIGDNETPASVGVIELPRPAIQISAGDTHACAVLDDYSVYCWGRGADGRLGYANVDNVGDDETPMSVGPVDVF